jgi:hypothetical protein
MTLLNYVKGLWTALLPAATKAKMENIEDGIKAASDVLDLETDAGRALTQAADAEAQRSALGLGDSATLNVGTGAGDVAAGNAPAAAQAAAEATAAGALEGHVSALDPHTQYAKEADLGDSASKNVGTGAGDVAAGNALPPLRPPLKRPQPERSRDTSRRSIRIRSMPKRRISVRFSK